MFFALSKIVWFFLQPSAAFLFLSAGGFALSLTRFRRLGRAFLAIGLCGLFVISFSPLGRVLTAGLEDRIPRAEITGTPAGIIVLGGAVHMEVSAARGEPAILSGGERLLAARQLAERYPGIPLLLSGGNNALLPGDEAIASEAEIMAQVLTGIGVAPERLILEKHSRNTHENAVKAKAMAAGLGASEAAPWLLITSAYHMPRALGTFRAAGFEVLPYPADYQTGGEHAFSFFYFSSDGIAFTDFAVKEWLGLTAYYLTGKTDALFPAS